MSDRVVKTFDDGFRRFDTLPECDRQTSIGLCDLRSFVRGRAMEIVNLIYR